MNPNRLVLSRRDEKAKRLNANEDNLLQMEMERFKKQHSKEIKNILLERQIAKEAMSDIRRHRTSSLLAARRVSQENNACYNNTIGSPTLSAKLNPESKANRLLRKLMHSTETQKDISQIRQPCFPNPTQKSPNVGRKFSKDVVMNVFTSIERPRRRAQTFSQGTTVTASNLESVSQNLPQRSPNLETKFTHDVVVSSFPSPEPRRNRTQTFSQGTTVARTDLESVSPAMKTLEPITIAWKLKTKRDQGRKPVEERPRSFSDCSSSLSTSQNSPERESVRSSPSLCVRALSRSPLAVRRRVSVDDVGRLFIKRSSLEVPGMNSPLPQRKLSPSTGITKFRQTGAAASAAQVFVSSYERKKSISKAAENLIIVREKREMVRQKEQQVKADSRGDGSCYKRTTGLKERFCTIVQLVIALNALKTANRRRRISFVEEETN